MELKNFRNYNTEEFILDNDFMDWVLHPNLDNSQFWTEFITGYPHKTSEIQEAVFLIKTLSVIEPSISQLQLDRLYSNIKSSSSPAWKRGWFLSGVAAVIIFLISISGLLYYLQHQKHVLPFETINELTLNGKVILPDGQVNEFETEQTEIKQNADGQLTINNDKVIQVDSLVYNTKREMAHVIIPYGKRSRITLADGSIIWLNSGSRLSYPVNFNAGPREVYLSGEAFFDINGGWSKPFNVITSDLKILVSGTRFNVSCYPNDETTQAVLVSGSITAGKNKMITNTIDLNPGDRIIYNKAQDNLISDHVDTELYSSWINGYLIFEKEPLAEIFKKLKRYYNKEILTENLSGPLTFSGKLDLADDLEKVLKNISFTIPFSVVCENDFYIVKQ